MFYDIVEISPAFVVIKFSGSLCTDTTYLKKLFKDFEDGVGFKVDDRLESAIAGLIFVEEIGNLLVAARQGKYLSGALDGMGVCCKRGYGAAVSPNAYFI